MLGGWYEILVQSDFEWILLFWYLFEKVLFDEYLRVLSQKYSKDVQEVKKENQEEIRKLRQQCEDKDDKIKTLNHKLVQEAQDK